MPKYKNKIFGIGWAKTGTTTLGKCFQILGFNHQSQNLSLVKYIETGDLSQIMAFAKKKDTFEDWPWIVLYKELDRVFPGSKFILTKRKTTNWARSYFNMLANQGNVSKDLNKIRRILYELPFPEVSKHQLVDRYEKHNADVEYYFRRRPEDLLIVDWEEKNGWSELCEFLGQNIPNEPFPHANKGNYNKIN